jgi:hypothetical protein
MNVGNEMIGASKTFHGNAIVLTHTNETMPFRDGDYDAAWCTSGLY